MSDYLEDELAEAPPVPIPDGLSPDSVVAIITVYHPQALQANRNTAYRKSRLRTPRAGGEWSLDGCHIFLHVVQGQPYYTMGRTDSRSALPPTRDVYIPSSTVGIHQFGLIPVWESNSWRLQSASETIAEVNGAPIQLSTPRTRKLPSQLPQAIHLRQNLTNYVFVNSLRVDIFMLKTVREVYPTQTFWPVELRPQLQEVTHRPEAWARNRHLQRSQQISTNTYRVLERFTGKIETAKFFRHGEDSHELRHTEFLKFGKTKVDASLVRYLQLVEINHIPAVITETYECFEPYAALEESIKKQHPRVRFTIASKLLRRLFSALAFLHFHKIIHANVTKKSILLRLVGFKPEAVLLVDYSDSTSFTIGAPEPHKNMVEDGRAAMEIVESCCDIWQLRKAATKDAYSEAFMAIKTEAARKEFALMERVVADFFGPKGESRESEKGKKMLRLLEHKENNWHIARDSQIHNATRREVGPCRSQTIQEMEHDWTRMHPPPKIGEEQHMLLTLGHPYLDGLASKLYHNRWDLLPRDVCAEIEQLAGSVEEPWQTFSVKQTVSFTQGRFGFEERCILKWLAGCCEAYQEWRCAFVKECERHIVPQHGIITSADIEKLREALTEQGSLPEFMQVTFARLTDAAIKYQPTTQLEETHQVWYHKPSRMFNLTQLHRLANPDRFLACINEGSLACDDFVEVRGEPKIEGLYASLSLLAAFGTQLELTVEIPDHTPEFPLHDPADFSRVLYHVVLAQTGLLPWASVTRERAQFNFHAPLDGNAYETSGTFLPTYFGSMKPLPTLPYGREVYQRPDHWSKFQIAKEIDEAANLGKRTILTVKGPLKKRVSQPTKSYQASMPRVDQSILSQALETRKRARAEAQLPAKRNLHGESVVPIMPAAKRSHILASINDLGSESTPSAEAPQFTTSFMDHQLDRMMANIEGQAEPSPDALFSDAPSALNESFFTRDNGVNANLLISPPEVSVITKKTFTVASNDEFNLGDDYKQAEDWLKIVEKDDAPQVDGIFGLNFHHSFRNQGDGSDTEPDESDKEDTDAVTQTSDGKAKQANLPTHKIKESNLFTPASRAMTPPDRSNQQAVSQSFPGRSILRLATPNVSNPAFPRPAFLAPSFGESRGYRYKDISISDLASVDLHNASTPSSPPPPATGSWNPAPLVASSPPQPTRSVDARDFSAPVWTMRAQRNDNEDDGDDDVPNTKIGERFSQDSD